MNSSCDSCAFGTSGGAADEASNRLKSIICAYGAHVFWCHHGRDEAEYDWKGSKLGPMLLAPQNRKVCGGWQRSVARLKRLGFFANADYLLIRKVVGQRALKLLERFIDKEIEPDEKAFVRAELTSCVKFIAAKDIGPLEIPL